MSRLAPISALALAALAAIATNSCSSSSGPSSPAVAVSVVAGAAANPGPTSFQPNPATVSLSGAAQGRVRWTNNDNTTHTVTEDGGSPRFNEDNLAAGDDFTFDFTALGVGTYNYHCALHPAMVASVIVTP
jgi:plastocyanin